MLADSKSWKVLPFIEEYGLDKLERLSIHELLAAFWFFTREPRDELGLESVFCIFNQDDNDNI